jgi:cytochrome c-type biogenesis protein CcmH
MLFWLLAIAITAIACAALYYAAAGRTVNAPAEDAEPMVEAHYRRQLAEIATDVAEGRMGAPEGEAARRELAREYVRQQGETRDSSRDKMRWLMPASLGAVVVLAFATYAALGHPDLPAQPLTSRPEALAQNISIEDAIARVEKRLAETPDDLRGWTVIAPAYLQLGRYADAERAYRRILALSPPTADAETDLAEVLLAQAGDAGSEEAIALLTSAAARDPAHVRSRFYLAGEATRTGDYAAAQMQWTAVLAMAKGDEAWVPVARQGLAAAEAGLTGGGGENEAIRGMVEGLSARLMADGGSLEEWTQLVRSRLVLGERDAAQAAYDAAVKAYPDPAARVALDALARDENLVVAS